MNGVQQAKQISERSMSAFKSVKRRERSVWNWLNWTLPQRPVPRAIKHNWFLLIDPINHIKSLSEQASCFVRFQHCDESFHSYYWLRSAEKQ